MSNYIEVIAIVEGTTEQIFMRKILAPYLGYKNIGLRVTQVSKSGQKGGDVKFERVKNDILSHLRQRRDTIVTLFLDYYGLASWPGLNLIQSNSLPENIESILCSSTISEIRKCESTIPVEKRLVPFFIVHEFETLLFSDSEILAKELDIKKEEVDALLNHFGGKPENINNSRETAPSKRIELWKPSYKKTVNGIAIAEKTGIDQMRLRVPLFDRWLKVLESKTDS